MRAVYIWYSRGEARPARARVRASCARRSRSSTAWRVTISSTSQPREAISLILPSSPTAYTALRWPASVALPSYGTSRSRIHGSHVEKAAGEAAALRHVAEEALSVAQLAAAHQLVEHDVDRGGTGVTGRREVGEPALLGDGQAGLLQAARHLRVKIVRRHVRQQPVHVARLEAPLRDDPLERPYQRVLDHRLVQQANILPDREQRTLAALPQRIAHPAAQRPAGFLLRAEIHARRQLMRIGKEIDPLHAQVEAGPRPRLEQPCAGAVGKHPAQEVLVERELGLRFDTRRIVLMLRPVMLRAQGRRGDLRAGDHRVWRFAGAHRHPAVFECR